MMFSDIRFRDLLSFFIVLFISVYSLKKMISFLPKEEEHEDIFFCSCPDLMLEAMNTPRIEFHS